MTIAPCEHKSMMGEFLFCLHVVNSIYWPLVIFQVLQYIFSCHPHCNSLRCRLGSWGCLNKGTPQILWLKTAEIYSLAVLEDKVWNQGATSLPKALMEQESFIISSRFWWLQTFRDLCLCNADLCLHLHVACASFGPVFLSFYRNIVIRLGTIHIM
jgi:hypothetical protein